METTAREFARKFRTIRAVAARGKVVRVTAPEGVYRFMREKATKTCGSVLEGLQGQSGHGFLTEAGAKAIEMLKRKPVPAKSPWESRA